MSSRLFRKRCRAYRNRTAEDLPTNTSTVGQVAVGGIATGNIGTSNDRDWFAVELVAGRTYTIDLRGSRTNDGTLRDPYLRGIHDADGNLISGTTDDDGGTGYNSRLTFTATESGTHYIAAGAYSGRGTYEVEVTDTSPPVPEQQQTTTVSPTDSDAVREGATDLGDITALEGAHFPRNSLDGEGDRVDYYRFTLTEAKQIGLGLRQQDVNADLFLEDAEGNVLHSGTEAGTASEGILETLLAGTYYVRVETQEAGQNDYVFRYGVTAADPAEVTRLEAETNAAPTFGQQSYAFDLAENADGSTTRVALGTLSATDPEDATLSYSIEGGNSADLFEIDASTGALSYKGAGEDYESGTTSYELTVRASDGSQYSDVTAAVNISDVEEQAEPEPLISQEQQAAAQQTVSEPDGEDFPAGTSTAGRVVVGGSATGNIGRRSDVDWFAVELAEGSTYVIDLRGRNTGDGTLLNPYLFGIRDASGYHISGTANDNGGEPWNSRVIFTATESGTHFIAAGVGSWPVGESYTGTYTLAVSKVTDDLSADTGTRGAVAVGSTATGEIEFADDVDWFAVTLEAGKTYRFDLEGAWTNKGTLPSPALRGLYDATGARIDDTTGLWRGRIPQLSVVFHGYYERHLLCGRGGVRGLDRQLHASRR